jgi:hypothetical protein
MDSTKAQSCKDTQEGGWVNSGPLLFGPYRVYPITDGYTYEPAFLEFTFSTPRGRGGAVSARAVLRRDGQGRRDALPL